MGCGVPEPITCKFVNDATILFIHFTFTLQECIFLVYFIVGSDKTFKI